MRPQETKSTEGKYEKNAFANTVKYFASKKLHVPYRPAELLANMSQAEKTNPLPTFLFPLNEVLEKNTFLHCLYDSIKQSKRLFLANHPRSGSGTHVQTDFLVF